MRSVLERPVISIPAVPVMPNPALPVRPSARATDPLSLPRSGTGWLARWYGHAAEMSVYR